MKTMKLIHIMLATADINFRIGIIDNHALANIETSGV